MTLDSTVLYIKHQCLHFSSPFDSFPVSIYTRCHCTWFPGTWGECMWALEPNKSLGMQDLDQVAFHVLGSVKMDMGPLQQNRHKNQMRKWDAITSTVLGCSRCSIKVSYSLFYQTNSFINITSRCTTVGGSHTSPHKVPLPAPHLLPKAPALSQ